MADYIYLLENRLSPAQQRALSLVRTAVRARELTLFLTGGAVRDLTGGGSVRDLDITVQGETTGLRKDLESAGAVFLGDFAPAQALFFVFPGGVRVEVSAAMAVTYPKPGKPKVELTSISESLRSRDFTANAMALSLNEGSYGLLMDPLNGVADIENRELRLISNYGFIDDPARLVRAVRLSSRLGWQMEARTQQRYENAKEDSTLDVLSKFARGYELEEIFHEEDPQRIMRALDAEGWLSQLAPQLVLGKANDGALADLRDKQGQLQTANILADSSALAFPLLLAKLPQADVAALKASFARQGFVQQIELLDERMRELQQRFNGKDAAQPSAAWRMLYEAEPGLVLAMFYAGKGSAVQARLKTFLTESPTARQRLPYQLMQEMRILPDNPVYGELLDKVFFELMDGKLQTPEEMKAYLEPYSPPAPPPPLNLRRARAKKEARPSRAKAKKAAVTVAAEEEAVGVAKGLMEPGTLTGPDRGDTPTKHEPLEGKVAPLPSGEPEPEAAKPAPRKSLAKAVPASAAIVAETGSAVAKKLSAKPAPMPEAEALLPHPEATKQIAEAPAPAVPDIPGKGKATGSTKFAATDTREKSAAAELSAAATVKSPGKKAAPAEPKPATAEPKAAPAGPKAAAAVTKSVAPIAAKSAAPGNTAAKTTALPVKTAAKTVTPAKDAPAAKGNTPVKAAPPAKALPQKSAKVPATKAAATKPAPASKIPPARVAAKSAPVSVKGKAVPVKGKVAVKAAPKPVAKKVPAAPQKAAAKTAPAGKGSVAKKAVPAKAAKSAKRQ